LQPTYSTTNWQFEFLRPTIDEIVTKYLEMHGSATPEEEPKEGNIIDSDQREEEEEMEAGVVDEQEQEQMLK
jgi:hypothetical protein